MKIPFKINIYLLTMFCILILSTISYAYSEAEHTETSLEDTILPKKSNNNDSSVKKNTEKESAKDKIIMAYTVNLPRFSPFKIPPLYPSKSKIAERVKQIADEITALAKSSQNLYDQTAESQVQNNQVYTDYRKIIDSLNTVLDGNNSLPGDPELTHKVSRGYKLLEKIKHTLSTLQTINMELRQQSDINKFLIASIERTKNIEVANKGDKLNLTKLSTIIKHNSLYVELFKKYFNVIMVKHELLISRMATEISRVNAGVIAGKSVKVIFQDQEDNVEILKTNDKAKTNAKPVKSRNSKSRVVKNKG